MSFDVFQPRNEGPVADDRCRTKIYLEADAAMNTYETAEGKRTSLNLVQRKVFHSEVTDNH